MEHPKLLAYSTPKYSMDINWKIILGFFPRFKSIIIDDSNLAADWKPKTKYQNFLLSLLQIKKIFFRIETTTTN